MSYPGGVLLLLASLAFGADHGLELGLSGARGLGAAEGTAVGSITGCTWSHPTRGSVLGARVGYRFSQRVAMELDSALQVPDQGSCHRHTLLVERPIEEVPGLVLMQHRASVVWTPLQGVLRTQRDRYEAGLAAGLKLGPGLVHTRDEAVPDPAADTVSQLHPSLGGAFLVEIRPIPRGAVRVALGRDWWREQTQDDAFFLGRSQLQVGFGYRFGASEKPNRAR